jgi:hypothetical protein
MGVEAALLSLTAVSTVGSIQQQQKAGRAQQRGQQLQQKIADAQARRERIQELRRARIARAQATAQQSGTSGGLASSQSIGTQSTISSQLGANIAFSNQQSATARQITAANIDATKATTRAGVFDAVGNVSNQAFNQLGGYDELFKKKPSTLNPHTK